MTAPIPFVDLAAQQARIRADVDRRIAAVLDHGGYVMGPEIAELEAALAERCRCAHAVGCSSGTDALVMALMAKGVGPGHAVLVPTFTFAATAEAVVLVGATPVFCDILPDTFNLDPDQVADGVDAARAAGLDPVALIAVDLFGQLAEHPALGALAERHGLWVLADAAQSFGATLDGRPAGSFGLMTATSFFPAKPLGCYGDGGAVFTDDDDLAAALQAIRIHGKGTDKYDNTRIGLNARLDTIQAAVLLAKLEVFDDELLARQRIADRYTEGLADAPLVTPVVRPGHRSAWAQYTLVVEEGRDALAAALRREGIPTAIYYPTPLHQQPAYQAHPAARPALPVAERLAGQVLSLPFHPYLEPATQDRIVDAVRAHAGQVAGRAS